MPTSSRHELPETAYIPAARRPPVPHTEPERTHPILTVGVGLIYLGCVVVMALVLAAMLGHPAG